MIVRYFVNMARGLQDVVDMASAIATLPRHRMSTEIGGQAVVACRIRLRRPSTSCQARYAAYFFAFYHFHRLHRQSKEASILRSHHEETRELLGEKDNARNNARCT